MVFKKQPSDRTQRAPSERTVSVSLPDDLIAQLQHMGRTGGAPAPLDELVREAVAGYVAGQAPNHEPFAEPKLSRRQRQVLEMIARGRTTKEIAQHLGISIKTADWHRGQLMKTLNLHGVVEVVRYAIRTGIIQA